MSEVNKTYSVRTRKLPRRFRAGHCFGKEATTVELTPAQAEMVKADPELVCADADVPADDVPAAEVATPSPTQAQAPKAKAEAKAK
jgi:hypothetical protein